MDLTAGQIDEDFADVQPQTAAPGIHATGAVLFVEALKHKGQRFGGNTGAGVFDADFHHIALSLGRKGDGSPFRGEFDGVVYNVVDHLMHKVRVGVDGQRRAAQPLNVDFSVLDTLLVAEHHVGYGFPQIIVLGVNRHFPGLQLGDVQHILHQPGQASGFLRNDGQVMVVFLRRDGSVQHTVDEALDGGHGGAQLVGNIAHELTAGIIDGLQTHGHVVEGGGEIRQLHAAVHRGAGCEIAAAQPPGGFADVLNGARDAPGQHPAQQAAQQQNGRRRDAEHHEHIHDIGPQCRHGTGRKEVAYRAVHVDASAGRVIFVLVDTAQGAGIKNVTALVHLVQQFLGNVLPGKLGAVGVNEHLAILRSHKDQGPRRGIEQFKATAGILGTLIPQRFGDDGTAFGKALAQRTGTVQNRREGRAPLVDKVGSRQGCLDGAHNTEPQHQHHRNGGEEFPADGIAAAHSRTSNL